MIDTVAVLVTAIAVASGGPAQALAGGEIEERLREKVALEYVSQKTPAALELCVADAIATRGLFPHVYRMPDGGLFLTVYRANVTVTPTPSGSRIVLSTRGDNDKRIGAQLTKCL